jgi:hypothetical protein
MKSKDFANAVHKLADVFAGSDTRGMHVAGLHTLASVFDLAPKDATVAQVVKRLKAAHLDLSPGSPSVGDLVRILDPAQKFLSTYGKPSLVADIKTVQEFLQSRMQGSVQALLAQAPQIVVPPPPPRLREDVVQRYLHRLEGASSDPPKFMLVWNEIAADAEVGKLEAVALAKRFTGSSSATKLAALNKLRSHHRALVTLKAKTDSRSGRSAA